MWRYLIRCLLFNVCVSLSVSDLSQLVAKGAAPVWSPSQTCGCLSLHHPETIVDIFWHMVLPPPASRHFPAFEAVFQRQLHAITSSGLLQAATVHVGLVGPAQAELPSPLQELLAHPHVRVANFVGSGYECETTRPMWQYARDLISCCPESKCCRDATVHILYINNMEIENYAANVDDCNRMKEYFLVEHWLYNVYLLHTPAVLTTGATFLGGDSMPPQYPGNFFWASVEYIAELPKPSGDRFTCGDSWLLQNRQRGRHAVLHRPPSMICCGFYTYRYPRELYDCPSVAPPHMTPNRWIPSFDPCFSDVSCFRKNCSQPSDVARFTPAQIRINSGL